MRLWLVLHRARSTVAAATRRGACRSDRADRRGLVPAAIHRRPFDTPQRTVSARALFSALIGDSRARYRISAPRSSSTAATDQLGSFRENDNTFASVGGNVTRTWAPARRGISFEHTRYLNGSFASTNCIANDAKRVCALYPGDEQARSKSRRPRASHAAGRAFSVHATASRHRNDDRAAMFPTCCGRAAPAIRVLRLRRRHCPAAATSGSRSSAG